MLKIPVQIGELQFGSKGEAAEHFRQMLYRHPAGSRIPAPGATKLSWLLDRHSEITNKIFREKISRGPEVGHPQIITSV